jgi:hypothetical protein
MLHVLRRGYPMALLDEAAKLAREKDRNVLLKASLGSEGVESEDVVQQKVFLITTFHPTDHSLREIVHKNWELLGRSPTTSGLHERSSYVGTGDQKTLRIL